ncbi:accessory Sec system S-layer assembly protein [Halobacillus sp. A1]|uniref:accessory Sec system S-layer assembly protein n=1 Tax=Halobacillus sp. A1 TaxID=2880262 RepID=UPI0020A6631A|nr:accessory Sec system S-layer assembly protein [Halobacillus sp. A1]MCP3031451.1 accessory Sec system S-layer assembly protein [Halobacillus sp. A1]
MINFLTNRFKNDQSFDEDAVDAEDFTDVQQTPADIHIYPKLSLHPEWKVSDEDEYVFKFLNTEMKPLKPNQLSIHGYDLSIQNRKLIVDVFIRSSISRSVRLKMTTILLLNNEHEKVAQKEVDLKNAGTLPSNSSRPWTIEFERKDFFKDVYSLSFEDGWKIVFEQTKPSNKHSLSLDYIWREKLSVVDVEKLEKYVSSLTLPINDQLIFHALKATYSQTGELHATILIRNSSKQDYKIKYLPLRFEDANQQVIGECEFSFQDFVVQANTSKPWTFIFPKPPLADYEADLSEWRLYPIEKAR